MKSVLGVSLGSSLRDERVHVCLLEEEFEIWRRGSDGDVALARKWLMEADGYVDAIGLGGTNIQLETGGRKHVLREGAALAGCVKETPLVDGSGLKSLLESQLVKYLSDQEGMEFAGRVALVSSVLDRHALAASLEQEGCQVVAGDAVFALGLPIPFYSLDFFDKVADATVPFLRLLPTSWLYPTGRKQGINRPRYSWLFRQADILAGDFHLLYRYLPKQLQGQTVITSTLTAEDVQELRMRGAGILVTMTPLWSGRIFGANVMEAMLVALAGFGPGQVDPSRYQGILREMNYRPRVERLN